MCHAKLLCCNWLSYRMLTAVIVKSSLSCQGQVLLTGTIFEVHVSCALLVAPIPQDSIASCCKTLMLNISMVLGSIMSCIARH